jgi:hypothetical protein
MKKPTVEISDNAEWEPTKRFHMVSWTHPDEGWAPINEVMDDFLATAIRIIANESHPPEANWLFLNYEFGRLMVYPSAEDAFYCTRSEGVFFQLFSVLLEKVTGNYLEWELRKQPDGTVATFAKRPDDVPEWVDEATSKEISVRKWSLVHRSLAKGNASLELVKGRSVHALKIAAFEFDPTEGDHYLLDLTHPEFIEGWKKLQEQESQEGTGE